jgi:hypothetical protein
LEKEGKILIRVPEFGKRRQNFDTGARVWKKKAK